MTDPLVSISSERPTSEFRWLDRGGMSPSLQQKWVLMVHSSDAKVAASEEVVWRDVPTVKEKK